MNIELLSLVLSLRPLPPLPLAPPAPSWWGQAAHALLLSVVARTDPTLADSLHEAPDLASDQAYANRSDRPIPPGFQKRENPQALRPFTVSSLQGRFREGQLDPHRSYRLRFTSLTPELSKVLLQAILAGALSPGQQVELNYRPFIIESVAPAGEEETGSEKGHSSSWAEMTDYGSLSNPWLLSRLAPPRRLNFEFTSPCTFKTSGKHMPLPLPGLVFGSLLEKWNTFAPLAFPAETRRFAEECLGINRFQIESRTVAMKSGGLRLGAIGQCAYTCLNYDRYWMSLICVLAAFARFAGVGAGTSAGLGQCRLVAGENLG